jgi:hypothetical protein
VNGVLRIALGLEDLDFGDKNERKEVYEICI